MIRINLLPYKESTLVQWGQRQVLLYVVAVLVSGVICVIWSQRLPDPQKKKKALIAERARTTPAGRWHRGATSPA